MTKGFFCSASLFYVRFCGRPETMGKRSRCPPAGTEDRQAKRRRREQGQLLRYTFQQVERMRQTSYRTCTVTLAIPKTKRFSVVSELVREIVDVLQRHDGRRVQAKDEGAAHAMERVLFAPERDGSAKGIRALITRQKPKRGPDRGMRLCVQGKPEMVAVFATVVSGCAAADGS